MTKKRRGNGEGNESLRQLSNRELSTATRMHLDIELRCWPLNEPFTISRGTRDQTATIQVTITDESGRQGRGEACGVTYKGETPDAMRAAVNAAWAGIEPGFDRRDLLRLMPQGGARFAVDSALWDLEAKRTGVGAFERAGVAKPASRRTAYTIGIRNIEDYEQAAFRRRDFTLLKVKVASDDPLAAVAAVRRGAPDSDLIIDPNQAWSVSDLRELAPKLTQLGRVVLLEQPIGVGHEAELDGLDLPIPLCADELIENEADLSLAKGRFQVINIKLDKTGGLTAALDLAAAARREGFELMVGCMAGSSLSMAPAMVLAQQCRFVDLDGPLLQAEDWPDGLLYEAGFVHPPQPGFWG